MNQLTQEQIKILEDAFASYPEDYRADLQYTTMSGIQEQLNSPFVDEQGNSIVFYMTPSGKNEEENHYYNQINRMFIEETK